jgi:hypothetical protein
MCEGLRRGASVGKEVACLALEAMETIPRNVREVNTTDYNLNQH